MYTDIIDNSLFLFATNNTDGRLFINKRNPDGSHSLSYASSFSLNLLLQSSDDNVNGSINIYIGVDPNNFIGSDPNAVLNVYNSLINDVSGVYTYNSGSISISSQTFVVVQFVPGDGSFNGAISLHNQVLYNFTPVLPPLGYTINEVDPISGIAIPLITFLPD
jgi:hypothetical protein